MDDVVDESGDIIDLLRKYSRTHERGFPQTLLYTNEHHQADLAAIAEIDALRAENTRLSVELAEARKALENARAEHFEQAAQIAEDNGFLSDDAEVQAASSFVAAAIRKEGERTC